MNQPSSNPHLTKAHLCYNLGMPEPKPPEASRHIPEGEFGLWIDLAEQLDADARAEEDRTHKQWQRRVDMANRRIESERPNGDNTTQSQSGFIPMLIMLVLLIVAVISFVLWRVLSAS